MSRSLPQTNDEIFAAVAKRAMELISEQGVEPIISDGPRHPYAPVAATIQTKDGPIKLQIAIHMFSE